MVFDCKIWGRRVLAEYLSVFTIDMYTEDMMGLDYSVLHQPYIPQLRKRLALPRPRTKLGTIICLLMRRWVQVVRPFEHSEVIGAANTAAPNCVTQMLSVKHLFLTVLWSLQSRHRWLESDQTYSLVHLCLLSVWIFNGRWDCYISGVPFREQKCHPWTLRV